MKLRSLLLAVIAAILALPALASAATLVPLAPSSSWGSAPIHLASPPGDSRVFVAERGGGVRIVEDGVLQATPFLTVPNVDTSGERGLLSIAFAPDYAASGLFYLFMVAKGADAIDPAGAAGDLRVIEYRRSPVNPDLADPASARLVLKQVHGGATNHNGGQLAFGPEGLLYVTMGDAANSANAQALANDLGKILRIDPREQPGGVPFGVPASNPFVGIGGARPEIYALGLRNPYRASFAPNGDLVLPDVGQSTWEEVNLGKATGTAAATTLAGANLGWPTCEGVCTPANPLYIDPIFQYGHSPGAAETTGCAIIGGYVVRDPTLTGLSGRYLYGDACRPDLRTIALGTPGADPRPAGLSLPEGVSGPLGFGEDGKGCVYVLTEATAYRVAAGDGAACPQFPLAGPVSSPDTRAPKLSLAAGHRQRLRRTLRVFATCDEACSLRAAGALGFAGAKVSIAPPVTSRSGIAGERVLLPVKLTRKAYRRAGRTIRRGLRSSLRVAVIAADPSGNASQGTVRIRLTLPRS